MVKRLTVKDAVSHLDHHGALLIFPIKNRTEPISLWQCFFPRKAMKWEWTEDADDGVVQLWHLRALLSSSRRAVYTKWYQGRATVLSLKLFRMMIGVVAQQPDPLHGLSLEARAILEVLEDDSPLPTKRLRSLAELSGKENERAFSKAMRELWSRLLIVGYGEVEEGGFPSLAVGATRLLFEQEWEEGGEISPVERERVVVSTLSHQPQFLRAFRKFEQLLAVKK
jgi:hypothetical protein